MNGFNDGGQGETGESLPVQPQGGASSSGTQRVGGFDVPSINLPKGGGARGIGEKLAANLVKGTGTDKLSTFGR